MRLVTVNLLGDCGDPADLARFLAETEPDVLCGQEVGPAAARVLETHFDHGRLDPAQDAMGKAMVATGPIDVAEVELPFRGGYTTVLPRWSGLEGVRLIGIHLANPIDPFTSVPVRRRQLAALEPSIWGGDPLVLVGDMNATPRWPAYRRMNRHLDDLVASWADVSRRPVPKTWSRRPGGRLLLRIDHVLGRGVRARNVRAERLIGVDHLALVVDLVSV